MNQKLNLKEAFRYSSNLNELIVGLERELYFGEHNGLIMKITENHKRSEANSEAKDELVELELDNKYNLENVDVIISTIENLNKEKVEIVKAIEKAKQELKVTVNGEELSIDAALQLNNLNRKLANDIINHTILRHNNKTESTSDTGYMLNEERNQVSYKYPVDKTLEIIYDRPELIKKRTQLLEDADDISRQVDELNDKRIIDITPKYSVYDTVESIMLRV